MNKLFNTSLPKWPALAVTGKRVSKEEAAEIIIRTQNFYFDTNDKEFECELNDACGIGRHSFHNRPKDFYERVDKLNKKYSTLPIEYLQNHMIVSSWVGGAHGWCRWDGHIFTCNYNIGKWPCAERIFEEWKIIAKEFPFLDLRSQLFNKEVCEDDPEPLIEFVVKNGKVELKDPEIEMVIVPNNLIVDVIRMACGNICEHGCLIEDFKEALEICEKRLKSRKKTVSN